MSKKAKEQQEEKSRQAPEAAEAAGAKETSQEAKEQQGKPRQAPEAAEAAGAPAQIRSAADEPPPEPPKPEEAKVDMHKGGETPQGCFRAKLRKPYLTVNVPWKNQTFRAKTTAELEKLVDQPSDASGPTFSRIPKPTAVNQTPKPEVCRILTTVPDSFVMAGNGLRFEVSRDEQPSEGFLFHSRMRRVVDDHPFLDIIDPDGNRVRGDLTKIDEYGDPLGG